MHAKDDKELYACMQRSTVGGTLISPMGGWLIPSEFDRQKESYMQVCTLHGGSLLSGICSMAERQSSQANGLLGKRSQSTQQSVRMIADRRQSAMAKADALVQVPSMT